MGDYKSYRQRFNLTTLAWGIVENDAEIFTNAKKPSIAGMINLILGLYMDDAEAAIDKAVDRRRTVLMEQLTELPDNETKDRIIEVLLHKYIDELTRKTKSYRGEKSRISSLTEDNYEFTIKWHDTYKVYKDSISKFFNAVIEEYARKTYYEREAIILQTLINSLTTYIEKGQILRIKLKNGRKYRIRPFDISHDTDYNYHYLVGMAKKEGSDYNEKVTSFRLSGIKECKPLKEPSGRISASEKKQINQRMKNSGVQFLLDDQEMIMVQLTAKGKKFYESQFHLRPNYVDRKQLGDDSWLYTFECTPVQAEYYFFKFGADAEVLSPDTLRKKFWRKYSEAYQKYDMTSAADV